MKQAKTLSLFSLLPFAPHAAAISHFEVLSSDFVSRSLKDLQQ